MEQAASLGIFGALQKMTETFRGLLPILVLISLIVGVWLYYLFVARHQPAYPDWKDGIKGILRFGDVLATVGTHPVHFRFGVPTAFRNCNDGGGQFFGRIGRNGIAAGYSPHFI